ncbi:MAG: hypothetical protein AAF050_17505 [Cyanobacteria bacterium J06649_5]
MTLLSAHPDNQQNAVCWRLQPTQNSAHVQSLITAYHFGRSLSFHPASLNLYLS